MLSEILTVISPVFLISLLGYVWGRSGRPFDTSVVTTLAVDIGVPCLVIDVLLGTSLGMDALARVAGASLVTACVVALAALVVIQAARLPWRVFLPALTFGNTGNMGLSLCLFAFGDEGLALAIAYFVVFAVLQFTLGVSMASGRFAMGDMIRSPVILSVLLAVALLAAGVSLPAWLQSPIELLGGMTIPLMLLTLGVSLGRLKVMSLGRSAALGVVRLALGFAAGYAVAELFGLEGATRGVVIIESSMPVAVINYLFAMRYDNRPEEVAGMVVISTALSFVTLPLLLAVV